MPKYPRIILDSGHGGTDPGACGLFKEKDMTLQISKYQEKRFRELGFEVAMTRNNDTYVGLTNRGNMMKAFKADVCICNHINAAANTSAKGAEVIVSIYSDGKLANNILDKLVGCGLKRRKVFSKRSTKNPSKDYFSVHSNSGSTATQLIEYGFVSNPEEAKDLQQNWKEYAEAVVIGVCNHYNIDMAKKAKPTEKVEEVITKVEIENDIENDIKNDKEHFAEKDFEYLNKNGITIHEKQFDKDITRGEAFALLSRLVKAIKD